MTVLTSVAPQKEKEPNTVSDKSNDVLLKTPGGPTLARVVAPKRHFSTACRRILVCLLVMCIVLFLGSILVGMVVYKNMYSVDHTKRVTCRVQYPSTSSARSRRSFDEEVAVHPDQEWLKVPQIRRRHIFIWVIHLFKERQTILKLSHVCLLKPMRPDLYMSGNPEKIMESLFGGNVRPFAQNRREDWEIQGPPIPARFLQNFMSGPILEICKELPVYHLVPARIKELMDRPFRPDCPMLKCRPCPANMYRLKDRNGCQTCQCADNENFCQLASPCDIACPTDYRKDYRTGCKLCSCEHGIPLFTRQKREALKDRKPEVCPIAGVTFEGMPILDADQKDGIAVTDYIRACDSSIRDLLKE